MGKLSEIQKQSILKMRELGMRYKEIVDLLGVSYHVACLYAKPSRYQKRKTYIKEYLRRNVLVVSTGGKRTRLRIPEKRPYTGFCELCGNQPKKLSYHHWDDSGPAKGLWLCHPCHLFAEAIDSVVEGEPN